MLNLQPSEIIFAGCSALGTVNVVVSKKAAAPPGVTIRVNITVPLGSSSPSEANVLYDSLISNFNAAALSGSFTLELRSVALSLGATSITFALVSQSGVATPFVLTFYNPTIQPTIEPSSATTEEPSNAPNEEPSLNPANVIPTEAPTGPNAIPTEQPSLNPANVIPTEAPTGPNAIPTEQPSLNPANVIPTEAPTGPNAIPTEEPS